MNNEMMPVPFKGATLYLAEDHQEPYVPMKPVVEGMGLAWQTQHRKFTASESRWSSVITMMVTTGSDGKSYEMICLPLKKLPGWLMSIDPNKVKPEIRQTVIDYQNECDDVLWEYWSNRRVPTRFNKNEMALINADAREVNEVVSKQRAIQRWLVSTGNSLNAASRKANAVVARTHCLDLGQLTDKNWDPVESDKLLALENAALEMQDQSPELDQFWDSVFSLIKAGYSINHSKQNDQLAINLKEVKQYLNSSGIGLPPKLNLLSDLKYSQTPEFVDSNRVISSALADKSIRCWIFQLN